jgi:hypothetical protein
LGEGSRKLKQSELSKQQVMSPVGRSKKLS